MPMKKYQSKMYLLVNSEYYEGAYLKVSIGIEKEVKMNPQVVTRIQVADIEDDVIKLRPRVSVNYTEKDFDEVAKKVKFLVDYYSKNLSYDILSKLKDTNIQDAYEMQPA